MAGCGRCEAGPATYRRRGPAAPAAALQRLLDGAADAVNRRLRAHRGWRVVAAASVPVAVGLIAARRRIGMHPAITLPLGCVPPLGCAIAVPKGRARYVAVAAAYMHLFKLGWELPYDDPSKLRRRLWIDEPIRFDTRRRPRRAAGRAAAARAAHGAARSPRSTAR